ncbi:hypothetical protein AKJ51_00525 [candidate division MSBL1 archaeon SCGC-AAA382A20]|uniref:SCP2 domain-containing protein n=1 Tax=candidate division MSBL1 archaeon SCGC-AAA382A20 TaxID=1698280 RepID=A0A133VMI3_9EURY|nr:hypothetical protein AKJ51_00525 [candidate division MSBL1 archaeon SCGC-AAA382A20]
MEITLEPTEPNWLTEMLEVIIRKNLKDSTLSEDVRGWKFCAGVTETESEVSSTLGFRKGEIVLRNGEPTEASVEIKADIKTLNNIKQGGLLIGLKELLKGNLEKKGSFSDLLKLQKVLSS